MKKIVLTVIMMGSLAVADINTCRNAVLKLKETGDIAQLYLDQHMLVAARKSITEVRFLAELTNKICANVDSQDLTTRELKYLEVSTKYARTVLKALDTNGF